MQPAEPPIGKQQGEDTSGLGEAVRSKLSRTMLVDRSGHRSQLTDSELSEIHYALNSLVTLDGLVLVQGVASPVLAQLAHIDAKRLQIEDRNLRSISALFADMTDEQLRAMSISLSMTPVDAQVLSPDKYQSDAALRVSETYRTLKLIVAKPEWFSDVVASCKLDPDRKKQDPGLYLTLDELCEILRKRDVIVTRNRDSAPFGLLMDALSLVRPGIIPAQIESYLRETRQGLGKSSFGRRLSEIEEVLPKAEIAPSQLSELDPGAGSDRHPSETT